MSRKINEAMVERDKENSWNETAYDVHDGSGTETPFNAKETAKYISTLFTDLTKNNPAVSDK